MKASDIKKLRGTPWNTNWKKEDLIGILDATGPFDSIYHFASFNLAWFVEKCFNNQQGKPLKLEAFQQVMLDMLWNKKFPMILATRGAGKTFMLALYTLLRCLLVPGSKVVIVGAGFRQAKLVFKYIEQLYESSPLIKEAVSYWGGPKFGSDAATLRVGLSSIQAIPIGDGEKIRGLRACVDPNTIIETNKGLMRISDSFENPCDFEVYTGDGKSLEKPSHYVKTNPINAYTVKTIGNYEFTCSDIHKVFTTNGFKYAKDLTVDDSLVFDNNYDFPSQFISNDDIVVDNDLAWALGLLISEGAVSSKHTLSVKMTELQPLDRLDSILSKYNLNVCRYTIPAHWDKRGWQAKEAFELKVCNKRFRNKLSKLGLGYEKAPCKKIPNCILASPKEVVKSFLSGLFHGDGSAFLYKDKKRDNNFGITYYTASEQLAIDVQVLLSKFDIFSTKGYRSSKLSARTQYHIRLYGRSPFDLYDILDVPKWEDVFNNSFKEGKFISPRKSLKVKSVIKLDGKHILYDYTIPKSHSFMGNGFRQHNTVLIADEFACLEKNTIVETENGLVRISDFSRVSNGIKLITGDPELPLEVPSKFIKTPLCDVYEITLANGYTIKCSENHKIMTNNGWKKPLEIKDDDWIESENYYKFPLENSVDNKTAWLMGILTSEGSIVHDKQIQITTTNVALSNKLQNEFNFQMHEKKAYIDKRGWNCKKSYRLYLHDKDLRDRLEALGLEKCRAKDKIVPWSILKSSESVVLSFLDGLYEGDGSCFLFKDRYRDNNIGTSYYSVSERLCRDVQVLLNKLGFNGYITYRYSKLSDNKQWMIRLNGRNAFDFASLFNIDRFNEAISNCYIPDIPKYVTWDKSRNKFKVQITHLGNMLQKRFDNKIDAFNFVNDLPNFRKVRKVDLLKDKDILYDYHLPKTHSFYADSFRQHNSIPEDIFDIVIEPFTAVHMNPAERAAQQRFISRLEDLGADSGLVEAIQATQGFGNQVVISGTPSYKHNHFYKRWAVYMAFLKSKGDPKKLKFALEERQLAATGKFTEISDDDVSHAEVSWHHYSVFQLPHTALPDGFMEEDIIRKAKATYPAHRFAMEYMSQFPDDTDGFIKRSWIDRATPKPPDDIPVYVELYGDPRATYVMGVDPARFNDNLGVVVFKVTERGRELVYCQAWDRTQFGISAQKIREIVKRFNIEYIAMDKGGGGEEIREWLCKKVDDVEPADFIWVIPDQMEQYTGDKTGMSAPGKKILEMVDFTNSWISLAAHGVESNIQQCHILFPDRGDDQKIYDQYMRHFTKNNIRDGEKEMLQRDLWGVDDWEADQIAAMTGEKTQRSFGVTQNIEECINETCAITRMVSPKGNESFELPRLAEQPEGLDMRRRDRWSALMLANYAAKVYMGTGHQAKSSIGMSTGTRRGGSYTNRGVHRRGAVQY